ncbi:MAG: hypothetical protein DME34_09255 [Verrucomicrobia bacterium]|nr:MAG: hypothetical protein DME34_09255 [Verrucomicrobiota bacterium]
MRDLAIGVSVTQSALCDQRRECEVLRFAQDDTPFFNLEAVPIAGRRRPTSGAVQETDLKNFESGEWVECLSLEEKKGKI